MLCPEDGCPKRFPWFFYWIPTDGLITFEENPSHPLPSQSPPTLAPCLLISNGDLEDGELRPLPGEVVRQVVDVEAEVLQQALRQVLLRTST